MAVAPAPPVTDLDGLAERCRWPVRPGETATAAVSGGPDSLALLVLARRAGLDVLAVHVDHGLRPGSAAEADHVAAAARRLGARFEARRASVDPGPNLAFRRNAVRHRLLPLLAEVAGRDPVPVLCRQADLLGDDADLLEGWAAELDPTDARALRAAPRALARRAVRRWLRHGPGADAERHPPSAAEVERVLAVARADAVACELAGGRRVRRRSGRLWLETDE